MEYYWILILVVFFATNSLDKAKSVKVKLEELPLKTFDEIFGEGWWDRDEASEDLKTPPSTNFGQNVHHQIDRQNTQIGQIEPNSTDQLGQMDPNSTDQNPPLTKSDHSGQIESNDHSGQIELNSTEKRKIVDKFHAMKNEFKQKGKYSKKEWVQIENRIAKHLKINRTKIFEWKKEFGLSRKVYDKKEERKNLLEKFDQMKAELMRDGFKNSYHELDKTVAKELGLSFKTISNWKRELGQTEQKKYSHSEQKELLKRYYEIKANNSKIIDADIAKMLKIGRRTLCNWKKQFKRQQIHQNFVDENSV